MNKIKRYDEFILEKVDTNITKMEALLSLMLDAPKNKQMKSNLLLAINKYVDEIDFSKIDQFDMFKFYHYSKGINLQVNYIFDDFNIVWIKDLYNKYTDIIKNIVKYNKKEFTDYLIDNIGFIKDNNYYLQLELNKHDKSLIKVEIKDGERIINNVKVNQIDILIEDSIKLQNYLEKIDIDEFFKKLKKYDWSIVDFSNNIETTSMLYATVKYNFNKDALFYKEYNNKALLDELYNQVNKLKEELTKYPKYVYTKDERNVLEYMSIFGKLESLKFWDEVHNKKNNKTKTDSDSINEIMSCLWTYDEVIEFFDNYWQGLKKERQLSKPDTQSFYDMHDILKDIKKFKYDLLNKPQNLYKECYSKGYYLKTEETL